MFGTESLRLLRENWPNATLLAEELYAIFQSTVPNLTGPLKIVSPDGLGPPLELQSDNPNIPYMRFQPVNSGVGPVEFTQTPAGGVTMTSPGPIEVQYPGVPPFELQPTTPSTTTAASGGGIPARVLSGGPGDTYQMAAYFGGTAALPTTVTAKQLQIDAAETIEVGTWTFVSKVGTTFYMQVPVWGPPS